MSITYYSLGTWLVLHKAQFPHEPQPSLSSLTQRFDVADLHSAARLGDVVLVQRLFARAAMVGMSIAGNCITDLCEFLLEVQWEIVNQYYT